MEWQIDISLFCTRVNPLRLYAALVISMISLN